MKDLSLGLKRLDLYLKHYQLADNNTRAYFAFMVLDILYNFQDSRKNKLKDDKVSALFPYQDIRRKRKLINSLRNKFLYDDKLVIQDNSLVTSLIDELILARDINRDPTPPLINIDLIKNQIDLMVKGVELIRGDDGLMSRFGIEYTNSDQDVYEELIKKLEEEVQNYKKVDDGFSKVTTLDQTRMEVMLNDFKVYRNRLVHEMVQNDNSAQKNFKSSLNAIWRVLKELDRSIQFEARALAVSTTHPKDKQEEKKSSEPQKRKPVISSTILKRIINSTEDYADDELNFTIALSIDTNKTEFVKTAISKSPEDFEEALRFFAISSATQLISPIHVRGVHFSGLYIIRN